MTDKTTIKQTELQYLQLQAELDQAREENDTLVQQEIEEEMSQLLDYLFEVKGLGGDSRKNYNEADRDRQSVLKAIQRAINTIAQESPDCACHLTASVRTGMILTYQPDRKISWIL